MKPANLAPFQKMSLPKTVWCQSWGAQSAPRPLRLRRLWAHHNNEIDLHGWLLNALKIPKKAALAASFGHPTAKEISASGKVSPDSLTRGSAIRPIGSRSPCGSRNLFGYFLRAWWNVIVNLLCAVSCSVSNTGISKQPCQLHIPLPATYGIRMLDTADDFWQFCLFSLT